MKSQALLPRKISKFVAYKNRLIKLNRFVNGTLLSWHMHGSNPT